MCIRDSLEAILLAAGRPLSIDQILAMFDLHEKPERNEGREAVELLQEDYAERGIRAAEVARRPAARRGPRDARSAARERTNPPTDAGEPGDALLGQYTEAPPDGPGRPGCSRKHLPRYRRPACAGLLRSDPPQERYRPCDPNSIPGHTPRFH